MGAKHSSLFDDLAAFVARLFHRWDWLNLKVPHPNPRAQLASHAPGT